MQCLVYYKLLVFRRTGNQALLNGKEVSKTKYCHQITAFVLNRLLKTAYEEALSNAESANVDIQSWRKNLEKNYPTFHYWSVCLRMEMDLFLITRSIRSRNFCLYRYAINILLKWMFSLDNYHYARWLSVHLLDMVSLEDTNNHVFTEFSENGNFVVARTLNRFSSMGIDQRHEQLNADIKDGGGAIGLTEDDEKFHRWMLCAPDEGRMVRTVRTVFSFEQN